MTQISVVLNSVSTGMDMAGLWPKYINIRRGSYIMAIMGVCIQYAPCPLVPVQTNQPVDQLTTIQDHGNW